jgi:hypothetical protein
MCRARKDHSERVSAARNRRVNPAGKVDSFMKIGLALSNPSAKIRALEFV